MENATEEIENKMLLAKSFIYQIAVEWLFFFLLL